MKSPYCWDCADAKQAHAQEYVKSVFKDRGCELFDKYKNNRTRMKFRCKCGRVSTITFASFHDKGCYCEGCGGKQKLTHEYVENEVAKFSYKLLSNYANAITKLNMICNKGHQCCISWNNFQLGKRCRTCFEEECWNKPEDRKFVLLCRSLLRNCLTKIMVRKSNKTVQMLGYDGPTLRQHLENHPNWELVKDGAWHVDHIFPIKAFCDYGIKDTKLINILENLRPLKGKDNLRKRAVYDKMEFEAWLLSKGVVI